MASNQTPIYGLNQWSLEDQVIMNEFNADNAKIEQALLDAKPKFQIGTYVGTGTCGPNAPCSLTFDFEPKLVIIAIEPPSPYPNQQSSLWGTNCTLPMVAIRGAATATVGYHTTSYGVSFGGHSNQLNWQGNTLTWCLPIDSDRLSHVQLNHAGETYRYIAIG